MCIGSRDTYPIRLERSRRRLSSTSTISLSTSTSPQISVCRLRFFRIFEAQGCPDAAWRIDFFQLVVTSFCIDCPMGGLALAAVPRHPDLGFMGSKSLESNGQELIEYMAAGIY
jgi:hypothetical protein